MKAYISAGLALAVALGWSAVASAQVKMGMAGPITGPSASTGAAMKNGVEQAIADINAAGGILGKKITLGIGDDASDPKQGVSVANKFVGDGIKFVVGDYNSGVSIPSSEVYQENGVLQISPASTAPKFTERKMWNTFRTCGRDDQQGSFAADVIAKKFAGKKIAFVHDKTTYGKGLADEVLAALKTKGMSDAIYEGVNTGEKDYSSVVSKIKAAGADLVFFGGLYTEGGLIARQMRDQGLTAPIMGGDGLFDSQFFSVGGSAIEGSYVTFGPDPTKNPAAEAVVKRLTEKKISAESYTLYSYASVQVFKQAAEKAKSLEPKKVAEAMHSGMVFNTVIGKFSFNAKGDRNDVDWAAYVVKKAADGKLTFDQLK